MQPKAMKDQLEGISQSAERWSPEDVLRWAFTNFQGQVEIASGFGPEGLVLIDIASRVQLDLRVFTLDTDFLFPETYALIETVEKRYGIQVERLKSALTPADQERLHGPALWSRDPDSCCNMRKVEPLQKKLSQLRAWVTSIRRDQTAVRARARKIEWDSKFNLVKINPIADWNSARVWRYIGFYDVPFNPLHDLDYPSIGCTHCTRAIQPGEDPRAGRWSGSNKDECGLHSHLHGGC
jgi:phosphoadenosine phosphosulfate reductase